MGAFHQYNHWKSIYLLSSPSNQSTLPCRLLSGISLIHLWIVIHIVIISSWMKTKIVCISFTDWYWLTTALLCTQRVVNWISDFDSNQSVMVIADFIICTCPRPRGKSIIVSIYGESWWSFGSSLKYIVVHSNSRDRENWRNVWNVNCTY